MNFGNTTVFQLSKAKMAYLGQRQAALALNVANVDTPGYKAQDVKKPDFSKMINGGVMQSEGLTRTHTMHMKAMGQSGSFSIIDRVEIDENNPNANAVNIDTELQKVAFTQSEYAKAISIYRKNLSFVRLAIGNPNS